MELFSILRPASELAIARAFARMHDYHGAFTSCNANFRLDPDAARGAGAELPEVQVRVPRARALRARPQLRDIFGRDLLDDEGQFEGFALLARDGGHKPFECVGEEQESLAAMRLLAGSRAGASTPCCGGCRLRSCRVRPATATRRAVLALSDDHAVPEALMADVHVRFSELEGARGRRLGSRAARSAPLPSSWPPPALGADRRGRVRRRPGEERRARASQAPDARSWSAAGAAAALSNCDVVVRSPGVSIHRPSCESCVPPGFRSRRPLACGWRARR